MNLAMLERMVSEGDMSLAAVRYLAECHGECEWLDYKEIIHLDHDKELCDFARDILAMKNVGGGYIVVGVRDKTWEITGLSGQLPYDTKALRDKVRHATGLDLDVDIVHHDAYLQGKQTLLAVIHIRASKKRKKRRMPSVVARDFHPNENYGLRRGEIYVRKGDSTVRVKTQDELEELLDALESQSDSDALRSSTSRSPFAVEEGTYRLLEKGFDSFIGRTALRGSVIQAVTQDPRIWIINVHGPGGVGKSALVNWVTYEFYRRRDFEAIIQLTAKETILTQSGIKSSLTRSLYSLENLLEHILNTFEEAVPDTLEDQKRVAQDLLSAWKTLLVLDNMETVSDGRIMKFVQELPPETKAKVVITSRTRTGGWELPIPVNELSVEEVQEFLEIRSLETGVAIPKCDQTCERVWKASGGLPLSIQWIIGQYKLVGNLDDVLTAVGREDSPVLEFTFRNIWDKLSPDARAILAVMTIFDEPATTQNLAVATEWAVDRIEKALAQLEDVTLVNRTTRLTDGRVLFSALPITLSFARHQLATMGDFEIRCRQRYQRFSEQMQLHENELRHFQSIFEKYGLHTDSEKRAAILCRRGESEMFAGNTENAALLFKQARETAPRTAYVLAMNASYEMANNRLGAALDFIEDACRRTNRETGALCYTIKARILEKHDRAGRLEALRKALEFDPKDVVARHQYGVALSRAGRTQDAINEFSTIIDQERSREHPGLTILMALNTRSLNYKRLGKMDDAKADILSAKELIKAYPYLAESSVYFDGDDD